MGAREKIKEFRESHFLDYHDLQELTGIGSVVISMVEHGHVTHPKIVEKFKDFFNLTELESEELLPKNRRPHDPEYDPDKYVALTDRNTNAVGPKKELVETYMNERHDKQIKRHEKRSAY